MKCAVYFLAATGLVAASCVGQSDGTQEDVTSVEGALGAGQNQGAFLTLRSLALPTSENQRQQDTVAYYSAVGVSPNGSTAGGTIASRLSTLGNFISFYGLGGANEKR